MVTIFKEEQIIDLSQNLNIPKTVVSSVLSTYIGYLQEKISEGKTIKFLNICYIRVNNCMEEVHETLAYISHEIGNYVGQSQSVVYRILSTFEETIIHDVKNMMAYSIKGIVRFRLEQDYHGNYKVRAKKSTIYDGYNIRVITTGNFKRKVETLVKG